jgi:HK97 family phage major capsid protein
MKTAKLIELERDRLGLIDEARSVLDEINSATSDKDAAALGKKHEALMRSLDANALDIDEARMEADDDAARAARRPDMGATEGVGADDGLGNFPSGWVDARGNPVRVLAPNDRFATTRNRGMSFGDHIRALAVGPRNDAEKRALSEGTPSEGGYTVPTPLAAEFIDRLRAQSVAIRAGARTVPMPSETLAIARLDTDPEVNWRLENTLIDDSDPAFSRVLLSAKTLAGLVKVSRELLQDSVNVSEILTNAFTKVMALELDRVAMWGDGTDDGPVGITATSGINEVEMGTNGAVFTWDKAIDAVYEMQLDNAADPTAMVMHPRTGAYIGKMKDGNGQWIAPPPMLANIPRLSTTAAPIDEEQGSATNASSIVFGDFKHLFIGMRDQMNLTILKERFADYGQVGFLVWMRADVQLAHKASFCRLKGIIP